jgi:hypothetical protein
MSIFEIQSNTALTTARASVQFKHHDFRLYPVLSIATFDFYERLLTVSKSCTWKAAITSTAQHRHLMLAMVD